MSVQLRLDYSYLLKVSDFMLKVHCVNFLSNYSVCGIGFHIFKTLNFANYAFIRLSMCHLPKYCHENGREVTRLQFHQNFKIFLLSSKTFHFLSLGGCFSSVTVHAHLSLSPLYGLQVYFTT